MKKYRIIRTHVETYSVVVESVDAGDYKYEVYEDD